MEKVGKDGGGLTSIVEILGRFLNDFGESLPEP
jgi:hypothetical protein